MKPGGVCKGLKQIPAHTSVNSMFLSLGHKETTLDISKRCLELLMPLGVELTLLHGINVRNCYLNPVLLKRSFSIQAIRKCVARITFQEKGISPVGFFLIGQKWNNKPIW